MSDVNNNEELDPEIAALLGIDPGEESPDNDIQEDDQPVDISGQDEYLQAVLEGVREEIQANVLKNKEAFDKATNKDEKGLYRERFAAAYWNFYRSLSPKLMTGVSAEKQLALRYNLLDLSYITQSQLDMIKSIALDSKSDSVFFLDEWLKGVAAGELEASVIDETVVARKKQGADSQEKLDKKLGQKEAELKVIQAKIDQVKDEESRLKSLVDNVIHLDKTVFIEEKEEGLLECYSKDQREDLSGIMECCKSLSRLDRELAGAYRILHNIDDDIEKLQDNLGDDVGEEDSNKVVEEFNTVKQMIKVCVGRQGNHFPVLMEHYFTDDVNQMANKANLDKLIKEVEHLDPGLFLRAYKGDNHRIFPYIILVPCFGDVGICWDPIPRNNRATGKGRIAVPVFPKNLRNAVVSALADLRWQVAKEKAQHYWMEEGLTGEYY
ncbi:MAG: hypothetical protein OEZ36_04410, partial [Spirochaetota bacterium]|nr:hypothetical protein [Spirochaetota bacterium]